MIMLLSGPPGVGKTLTAESVAENMHAPLYMMSAGDLGLESHNVETSLNNVLEMCTKWNAVLLLDEADVFLEQRSANDLERNKLVSSQYPALISYIPAANHRNSLPPYARVLRGHPLSDYKSGGQHRRGVSITHSHFNGVPGAFDIVPSPRLVQLPLCRREQDSWFLWC